MHWGEEKPRGHCCCCTGTDVGCRVSRGHNSIVSVFATETKENLRARAKFYLLLPHQATAESSRHELPKPEALPKLPTLGTSPQSQNSANSHPSAQGES